MPLASVGVCTVLFTNELRAFVVPSAHIARPSSPVLRMKLLRTVESVTPVWKFTASAIWSTMIVFAIVTLLIGPSSHTPTLVCWM